MKFTVEMRKIVMESASQIAVLDEKIKKLVSDDRLKGSQVYKENIAKAEAERRDALEKAVYDLEECHKKFREEIKDRYLPKGEELTPDANIFTSNIELTPDEIVSYMEKYSNNNSMTRLIIDYAKKKGIEPNDKMKAYKFLTSKEEMLIASDKLLAYCRSALTDPMYRSQTVGDEANYKKICGDALAND